VSTKTTPPIRNRRLARAHPGGELGERAPVSRVGPDEPLRLAHGRGAGGGELGDDVVRARSDLADEADAERDIGPEALARQHVAACGARADLREHERRNDRGDDPELDLREAELRALVRDGHVCAGREPAPAAEAIALDPRHDRRRAAVDGREHLVQPERVLDVLLVREVDRRALPFDVRARAEALAFAGEHHSPRIADIRERLGQLADHLGVERVSPLGLRDRDVQDVPVSLDAERTHARELRVGAC
jgi:hypothetical protein